jgi:hypothetical protein
MGSGSAEVELVLERDRNGSLVGHWRTTVVRKIEKATVVSESSVTFTRAEGFEMELVQVDDGIVLRPSRGSLTSGVQDSVIDGHTAMLRRKA